MNSGVTPQRNLADGSFHSAEWNGPENLAVCSGSW